MSALADEVLPLIRTRADLWRWNAANAHGAQMHEAVQLLRDALDREDAATVLIVTQKAIASSMSVIMRADDSSGIIGDACRDLLDLHPVVAAREKPPTGKLADWMIRFQFDNDCDYFHIDPVAYAPALGDLGMAAYRKRLAEIEAGLGPRPSESDRWPSPHSGEWFTLDYNAQRLAIHDRDIEEIIRTHVRDGQVPAWLQDTAEALAEIGETDLAIDWARRAAQHPGGGHQALKAGEYWCTLLADHRPHAELLLARLAVFRHWPSSSTAARLHQDARNAWPDYRDEVMTALANRPRDAVVFAQHHLRDVPLAWELAHSLGLDSDRAWSDLGKAYEKVDPLAVIPVYARLVEHELEPANAQNYRYAARRLARMRRLATGTEKASEVDQLIAELRETHRRRPRLQQEFTRAGLP
ncbi:MAG TPA: hypothetical protein VHC43_14180 [Mycobacteriales bacterium]|nr:hypothetical protein [Mycobacteriales bacterium]